MTKPCGRAIALPGFRTCPYPRMPGKQRCIWHILLTSQPNVQADYARSRLAKYDHTDGHQDRRMRVPREEWPDGERWCAGCQSFVPLFYCTGSRCKSCASTAAHAGRIEKLYGITEEVYEDLLQLQGGVCFICQRPPRTLRLAVDHDHETGEVRGLLCANNEHGCNRAILGNIKDMAMAKRILLYLTYPPMVRLNHAGPWTWRRFMEDEMRKLALEDGQRRLDAAFEDFTGTPTRPAPF